jgi:hypothetical protein
MLGRRALVFWIGVRGALVIVPAFGGAAPVLPAVVRGSIADIATASVLTLLSPMTWAVAAATGGLAVADVSATREATFLAHLGIGRRHVLAVGAAVACLAEAAIVILIALVVAWI